MNVELTEYPYFAGTAMTPDTALLDRLATEYTASPGRRSAGDDAVPLRRRSRCAVRHHLRCHRSRAAPTRFVPLALPPLGLLRRALAPRRALAVGAQPHDREREPPAERGAVHGRGRRRAADPRTRRGDDVLAYSDESLYDQPNPDNEQAPVRGLVDLFGYNEGYLLQIAEKPPAGLVTPDDLVVCPDPADGPLFCEYRTNRLGALRTFDPVAAKLQAGAGAYGALAEKIAPIQEPGITAAAWSGTASSTSRGSSRRPTNSCSTSPPRSSRPCRPPHWPPCARSPSRTRSSPAKPPPPTP